MHDPGPRRVTGPRRFPALPRIRRSGLSGPWRIAVIEGSMLPAIEPGDWLLVDPTVARWPRRGSVVVFREPGTRDLAIKRVAARPGDWVPFGDGWLQLGEDEAWLLGDATDEATQDAGFGPPVDARRYGPVPLDALVARAWFRYWPGRRIGRISPPPADLLERGREGRIPTAAGTASARPRG
jgi:signal peptidase I